MEKWYEGSADEVLGKLQSNANTGLTRADAKKRLRKNGYNSVYPVPKGRFREYLLHILTDFTSIFLMISAVVCVIFRHDLSAVVIALTVFLSYALCAAVYLRAQKVLENMGKFALPVVKVLRDARLYLARSEQVVKGDVIYLSTGDVVPCDCRLLESRELAVNENSVHPGVSYKEKDALFTSDTALATEEQSNMIFADSYILHGTCKAVVCETANNTVVRKKHRSKPLVSFDNLLILEKIRKYCSIFSLTMLAFVTVLVVLSLFIGFKDLFDTLLSGLSLAVASMSEMYVAFCYIVIACGVFRSLRQYKDVNAGALIKNSSALDTIRRVSCIAAPRDGCFVLNSMDIEQINLDDIMYGVTDENFVEKCGDFLKLAVISTGLYGGKNLSLINDEGRNAYSKEEDAIINCARENGLYNYYLEKSYQLISHLPKNEDNLFDTSLVTTNDGLLAVVRGDAASLIYRCSHRRINGEVKTMSAAQTSELLLSANRMAIGGYRVCAIATKETTATDLSKVSRLQRRLTFEGFIAFREILLPDAAKNIKQCEQAGIKVIMFTDGENESDRFTARSLGVIKNDEEIITAKMFRDLDDGVFVASARRYSLYQGFNADDKRRLVNLLRLAGETVAFLGGEVGENAAVCDADVGYSESVTLSARADKGGVDTLNRSVPLWVFDSSEGAGRGCDALKASSDVIVSVADKNGNGGFNAMVKSIKSAKSIYINMFHMLAYLLSVQIARLFLVILTVFTKIAAITPVQLVISGLIVDLAAVIIFAFDAGPNNVLSDRGEYLNKLGSPFQAFKPYLITSFILSAFLCLYAVLVALLPMGVGTSGAAGAVFIGLILTQLVLIAEYRSDFSALVPKKGTNNAYVVTCTFVFAFVALVSLLSSYGKYFNVSFSSPLYFLVSLIMPVCSFCGFEIYKAVKRKKEKHIRIKRMKEQGEDTSEFEHKKQKKKKRYIPETFDDGSTVEQVDPDYSIIEEVEKKDKEAVSLSTVKMAEDLRELVFLSVKCALCDWNPAQFEEIGEGYDGISSMVASSINTDSSLEVIASVLITVLGAQNLKSVDFDSCLSCAASIKEYMKI